MAKHNAGNERIKRTYFAYLREARRQSEASVVAVAKAMSRFEDYTGHKDFRAFHREQAVGFKRRLAERENERTGKKLSKATLHGTLQALKAFFFWLAGQPGFRSRLSYSDADYFNLSDKEARVAKATREQPTPTLEQIHHVLALMPSRTDIERRDRALIAFAILTGARDGALASFRLKHVDTDRRLVSQDAREVRTKGSKTFPTWFFPVGGEAEEIVTSWITHLRTSLLWSDSDPLFPATHVAVGASRQFEAVGLQREPWSGAEPIRRVFREAFAAAGLPYFHPHSFRRTLVRLGEGMCQSPEQFKAWSQNLGHEEVLTTFTSYGAVARHRQQEIFDTLRARRGGGEPPASDSETLAKIAALMRGQAA